MLCPSCGMYAAISLGNYQYRCTHMVRPGLPPGMAPGPPGHTGIPPMMCETVFTDFEGKQRDEEDRLLLLLG